MVLENYDEFSQKKKNLDNQKKQLRKKMTGVNKQKIQLQIDKLKKKFSQFVAGASNYNQKVNFCKVSIFERIKSFK